MKQLLIIFLSFSILFLGRTAAIAQKNVAGLAFVQLQIDGRAVIIDNFSTTDAVGLDNKIIHTACFDMAVNDLDATKTILADLQVISKAKKKLPMFFITFNPEGKVVDEKIYFTTTVQEIRIPALDASSKNYLKAAIKLTAASVQVLTKVNAATAVKATLNSHASYLSNFRLTLGSLPADRISKISSISIFPGDNRVQDFILELPGTDAIKWDQWFLTGAGGVKKEQGTIEILNPNMITASFTIVLSDVEIVSFSTSSSNQQTGKATIGLRIKNVALK